MSQPLNQFSDNRLMEFASRFQYPPTPDVAGSVTKRLQSRNRPRAERRRSIQLRSAWVVMGLLVLSLVILFAVPGVRAEIIRFFQVGVVRIFPSTPTLTTESSIPQIPMTATPITETPGPVTPVPGSNEPLYAITLSDLAGETTFEAAQDSLPFPVRTPKYPADLGLPNRVFLQEEGEMVILVWNDKNSPEKARLSLHEISPDSMVIGKFEPRVIRETQVNGNYAVWAQGPYLVQLTNGTYNWRRLVEGNTLIWEEDGITYRLESNLTLKETIRIAESLK